MLRESPNRSRVIINDSPTALVLFVTMQILLLP
jgi:hypothetical protein